MPASTAKGAATPPATEDVSDIMSAIQRVLAEHNMSDARFILELPNSPSRGAVTDGAAVEKGSGAGGNPKERSEDSCNNVRDRMNTDGIPPSPSSARAAATALLVDIQATPAAAPPTLPEHNRPPPRARSASVEPPLPHTRLPSPPQTNRATEQQQHQPSSILVPAPTAEVSLDHSAQKLDATARPPPAAGTSAKPTAKEKQETPSLTTPLKYSGQAKESREAPVTKSSAHPSSLTSNSADKGAQPPPSPHRPADLASELAELCRLSHEVALEVTNVEGRTQSKEPLHAFVGRSAILDDRRKRQSAMPATSQWSPSEGLPHFPTPPPKGSPPAASSSTHHPAGYQPQPSLVNSGSSGTSVAEGNGSADAVSARSPASLRRNVVLLSPYDRITAGAVGGGPSSVGSGGNGGGASNGVPSAGSLPSLVAAKKSAKPGCTPVFSILNKEGSRLLEGNGNGAANNFSVSANSGHSSSNNTNNGVSSSVSGCTPQPLTSPSAKSGTSSTIGSVGAAHHSRPSNVSLVLEDRDKPSLVYQPLVGTAAEEQANRHPSILVQPPHPRPTGPSEAPASATAPTTTTTAATTITAATAAVLPSSLWLEQSCENTRRAAQLQSQSRLSQTTEALTDAKKSAATKEAVSNNRGNTANSTHRRLFNPALSDAHGVPSTTPPLAQKASQPPPSSCPPAATMKKAGTSASAGAGSASTSPSRPSLREMLLEQQQLEDTSRRGLEQHAKLMQAAHSARVGSATTPNRVSSSQPPTSASVSASLGVASAPATIGAPVQVTSPVPAMPALEKADAGASGGDSISTSVSVGSCNRLASTPSMPATSEGAGSTAPAAPRPNNAGAAGIQVVKFTLPHDEDARQSVVQQLCRSSAGSKHVDSKDRYRAMLASQKEDFNSKDKKEEKYKDLLSRAVEYNRLQRRQ
ncbi:hypothetical protein ABL78_5652 [Leptomonas seymouri]|uniref:Uncharacterized protein n=1 Tax=Leptomonas seymouri TaxID=5684 RepID=A0A0N1I4I6_LEPSE|nr:hypothetical protein ABL78_5652 [Leptomonas seymouri]|eukprot:KPI85285.1 hypothetical protein ABL78_5652 [Leptomonas seymouri]